MAGAGADAETTQSIGERVAAPDERAFTRTALAPAASLLTRKTSFSPKPIQPVTLSSVSQYSGPEE